MTRDVEAFLTKRDTEVHYRHRRPPVAVVAAWGLRCGCVCRESKAVLPL